MAASWQVVGISTYGVVFAKVEDDGWIGMAFVNIENSTATMKLTVCADSGAVVGANARGYSKQLFSEDISTATCIGFSSDREVVRPQLNSSSDGMMLDGLPSM